LGHYCAMTAYRPEQDDQHIGAHTQDPAREVARKPAAKEMLADPEASAEALQDVERERSEHIDLGTTANPTRTKT
jgi:hypothetical protein